MVVQGGDEKKRGKRKKRGGHFNGDFTAVLTRVLTYSLILNSTCSN